MIRILDAAKEDLINAYSFYERQSPNLGDYFLNSLYSDIDSLLIYQGVHPVRFDHYHCMLSSRFPFAIYYTMENGIIFIDAILDCRQNPESIRKRLGE